MSDSSIGERLLAARLALGKTQVEMALHLDVSLRTYVYWESGRVMGNHQKKRVFTLLGWKDATE